MVESEQTSRLKRGLDKTEQNRFKKATTEIGEGCTLLYRLGWLYPQSNSYCSMQTNLPGLPSSTQQVMGDPVVPQGLSSELKGAGSLKAEISLSFNFSPDKD